MTDGGRAERRIGYAATALGVLGFSAKAIFTKLAYPHGVDPITLMTLRSLVAVPVLWLLLLISREPGVPLGGRGWLRMAWAGFASYYLASFLDFYGLQTVTAILERILLFLYPCFVVLLGALFARRRLRATTWLSLGLAYGGVVATLAAGGREQFQGDWLGLALILAAALIFATYYLTAGDLVRRLATVRFSTYLMSIAVGAILAHFLATRPGYSPARSVVAGLRPRRRPGAGVDGVADPADRRGLPPGGGRRAGAADPHPDAAGRGRGRPPAGRVPRLFRQDPADPLRPSE